MRTICPVWSKHLVTLSPCKYAPVTVASVLIAASADRNENTSPLLCLPAELRNKIWQFALSHEVVTLLKIGERRGGSTIFKVRLNSAIYCWLSVVLTGVKETFAYHTAVPSTFRLLQVCRQIYCETMLTSHEHTTFSFDNWWLPSINLLSVQRNAITKIRPTVESLAEHACGLTVSPYRKKHFPSLRELSIRPAYLLEIEQAVYRVVLRMVLKEGLHIDTPESGDDWKTWLTQQLKSIEGEDLKVVFED